MRNTKYYPLICADTENGDMMPLCSTENRVTMEQHHKLYLSEMIPHYYRLNANASLGKAVWNNLHIHCPLCGKNMNRMSTPTDGNRLPLYCCPSCSGKE